MSIRCVVPSCNTTYALEKSDSPNKKNISYHMFPKDEKVRQVWIRRCGRKPPFNYEHSFMCSKHFKDDDYERDLRGELLNIPLKKKLKPNAIPSHNLDDQDDEEESPKNTGRKQRYEQRERKKYIEEVLSKTGRSVKRPAEVNSTSPNINDPKPTPSKKKKVPEENTPKDIREDSNQITRDDSGQDVDEIDAAELQKLLNIILERIHCLEQESEGLTHIMEDIKGRIEKMQNKN